MDDYLVWDQHACLPLRPGGAAEGLGGYLDAGVDFVSVNVGFDRRPWFEAIHVLASFRKHVLENPEHFVLAGTARDVLAAQGTGRLAVAFDLEGAAALDGDIAMVEAYYGLGVRTMLIAYNQANEAGGGCHGDPDQGLTSFGREVVREMNRIGMLVDATHCSYRTTMDLFAESTEPVVFSHSVPAGVFAHERNVSDEQMRECAATGGVVGINGVGLFLGEPRASSEAVFRAVDYAVEAIGPDHVGIGLDYVVDDGELQVFIEENRAAFPADAGYGPTMTIAAPSQIADVVEQMLTAGYSERDVRAIAGENFLRVAGNVWQ